MILGDEYAPAQVDEDLLVVLRKGRGVRAAAPEPAPLTERLCQACLHEYDEDGYCSMCGRQREVVR